MQNHPQNRRVYDLIKGPNDNNLTIGFGSYGTVKLARIRNTNEVVAMKIVHGKHAKEQIDVQKRFKHPNIIKLLDYYYDKDRNVTYMVLEYAENGSLFERIKETRMDKPFIRKIFREVCSAVCCLHQNGIMHRDIKPENVLLNKNNEAKLCDFGFAAENQLPRRTICGTYQYMSPEMILKEPYTDKNDVWSLGILLFQMIQGSAPFHGESMQEVFHSMKKQIYFSQRFTKPEMSLIREILKVNSKNRPSVADILTHPYFTEQNNTNLNSNSKRTKSTSSAEEDSTSISGNRIEKITKNSGGGGDKSLPQPPKVTRQPQKPPLSLSHPTSPQGYQHHPIIPKLHSCPIQQYFSNFSNQPQPSNVPLYENPYQLPTPVMHPLPYPQANTKLCSQHNSPQGSFPPKMLSPPSPKTMLPNEQHTKSKISLKKI